MTVKYSGSQGHTTGHGMFIFIGVGMGHRGFGVSAI